MIKPLFLVDLDDNLFQTKRKMTGDEIKHCRVAALDKEMQPQSFMSQEQAHFVDWILEHATLVPVTARGTEETARVTLDFKSWQISSHGAVIMTPQGFIDEEWKKHILWALTSYSSRIKELQEALTKEFKTAGIKAWARINYEYNGAPIYLLAKHTDSSKINELYEIADKVKASFNLEDFFIHKNDNNIAWLPQCINKGSATRYLINKIKQTAPHTPVMGLGDSVSDYSFLQECSWFGMPKQSQIQQVLKSQLSNTLES